MKSYQLSFIWVRCDLDIYSATFGILQKSQFQYVFCVPDTYLESTMQCNGDITGMSRTGLKKYPCVVVY